MSRDSTLSASAREALSEKRRELEDVIATLEAEAAATKLETGVRERKPANGERPSQAEWKQRHKPYADFPLSYHPGTGRLYKKIRGTRRYFGRWDDWQAALTAYEDQAEDLHAGKTPKSQRGELTLLELCDSYADSKKDKARLGRISPRTVEENKATCKRVMNCLGARRLVSDLGPSDFRRLMNSFAKTRGLHGIWNEIGRTRQLFKFALDEGLIDRKMRFGADFKRPAKSEMRKHRAQAEARTRAADVSAFRSPSDLGSRKRANACDGPIGTECRVRAIGSVKPSAKRCRLRQRLGELPSPKNRCGP